MYSQVNVIYENTSTLYLCFVQKNIDPLATNAFVVALVFENKMILCVIDTLN